MTTPPEPRKAAKPPPTIEARRAQTRHALETKILKSGALDERVDYLVRWGYLLTSEHRAQLAPVIDGDLGGEAA